MRNFRFNNRVSSSHAGCDHVVSIDCNCCAVQTHNVTTHNSQKSSNVHVSNLRFEISLWLPTGVPVSCDVVSCKFRQHLAAVGASAEIPVMFESDSAFPLSSSSDTAPSTTFTEFTRPLSGFPR